MIAEIIKIEYPKLTLKHGEKEYVYIVEDHVSENFIKLGKAEISFNNQTKKISFVDMVKSEPNKNSEKNPHIVDIKGKDYMTYEGVLNKLHEKSQGNFSIVILESYQSDDMKRASCKVRLTVGENVFDGIGSSTPENTGSVTDHPIELSHTRAKGRAIRDYLNIGKVMAEELKKE